MIDRSTLARLQAGGRLSNIASSGVIGNDDPIREALTHGRLGAGAFDAQKQDPPAMMHSLCSAPRVVCRPHAVGRSRDRHEAVGLVNDDQGMFRGELSENLVRANELSICGTTGVR